MSFSVIAALGNPGPEYSSTRHNAGWILLDALAQKVGAVWKEEKRFSVSVAKVTFGNTSVFLVKPQSFMNESGLPLTQFLHFHQIPVSDIVICYDDIAFEPGLMRLAQGGSDAGHNGVASCIQHLGNDFTRARVGIGPKKHPAQDLADHVLGKIPDDDFARIRQSLPDFIHGLEILISQGLPAAQNFTNRKNHSL
jgi:PTH1 family peptidyl-tRNA hydrolase